MKLAIFDYDGTLTKINTLSFLLRMWGKLGYPKHRQYRMYLRIGGLYIRYKLGIMGRMTAEQMKKTAFAKFTRIFKGMSRSQINEFFEIAAEQLMPQMNKQVIEEVKAAKKQGYHTVLLSGFYEALLNILAEKAGIDSVLGTKMIFDGDIIESKKPMLIRTGTDKATRIRKEFADADFAASCSYADSISDLELLELVGTPVAVAPDEKLKRIAQERGWRIME